VPRHADEAEILRGGLILSFGLHREAGEIFAGLIEKGAAPQVADRAWYYLAKIRYQRGLLAEAQDALARIKQPLVAGLEEDRALLQAQLLMATGDSAAAAKVLAAVKSESAFVRFNRGVALIQSGDAVTGSGLLDEIGRAPATNEEQRNLRDRANVALGFASLRDGNPQRARSVLERVRLQGPHSNKALLGFGWAAAELKQPRLALVPWTELAGREDSDAAVLEARLALPYAYGELGAWRQSLDLYEQSITAFDRESTRLDESVAAIRSGKLIES
jgi:tetratricopeptide (TPR) repeat protein